MACAKADACVPYAKLCARAKAAACEEAPPCEIACAKAEALAVAPEPPDEAAPANACALACAREEPRPGLPATAQITYQIYLHSLPVSPVRDIRTRNTLKCLEELLACLCSFSGT